MLFAAIAFFLLPGLLYVDIDYPFWQWAWGMGAPTTLLIAFEAIVFYFAGHRRGRLKAKLALRPLKKHDLCIGLTGIFCALFLVPVVNLGWGKIISLLGIECAEKQQLMDLAQTLPLGRFIFFVAVLAVAVPIAEEIVFRRSLYALWLKINPETAFFGTAALFSVVHFFINGLAGLFLLGIIFQAAFLKSRNLAVPILIHSVFNATSLVLTYCFE